MNFTISVLLISLFVSTKILSAQEAIDRQTYNNLHFWTSVNSTFRLSQRWGAIADVHVRRENFIHDPNFYFLRLGATFWINDQFSVVGGGAALWLATETNAGLKYALERRSYQQALWRATNGRVTFLQRIRIEQRWHEVLNNSDGSVNRIRFSNRFRFLMSGTIRAFNNLRLPRPVVSNELLFHVGKEIVYNTFDQNRLFLGFNQRISKSWTMDYGYMLVYQQRYSGYEYDVNNTIRLFFYYSPDFRQKANDQLPHYPVGGIE